MIKINKLDELLAPVLKEEQIESYTTRNLVGPGENYGSVMLAVDVKLKERDEELNLVAKMCPPSEFIKKMFNIPVTFKKEVGFYSAIIPTLQGFQRERGCEEVIDFVPKYYGSRISLDPEATEVDDDACLLLENIKVKGFDIANRLEGFDLESAEFLIKDLATFHAVPIALRLIDPKRFQEKVMPFLANHITDDTIGEDITTAMINSILECAKKNLDCAQYVDRMEPLMLQNAEYLKTMDESNLVFATVLHCDFWVNNTMLLHVEGKPVKNAMVDFQLVNYGNPAHDLLFFIYSSLSNELISENYEMLIKTYHEKFINVLTEFRIDTEQFKYENFLDEIKNAAIKTQLFHILVMLRPIFLEKDKVKDLGDVDENELYETESLSDHYYSKLWFTILDFAKKGWI